MNHRTQNPEALAGIPIHIVAEIGARLQTTDSDPVESIRMAYTLLDAAEAGRRSLQEEGCIKPGLFNFTFERAKEQARPRIIAQRDADPLASKTASGDFQPVDFEQALSQVFGRATKKPQRESRLVLYLSEKASIEDTNRALQEWVGNPAMLPKFQTMGKAAAEKNVREWKSEGIPFHEYLSLKTWLPAWWKDRLSRTQAAKRKGKTKGKQGRVIRKNDKRKGSKAGSFLKALKKTS
jgi:hypothetical protein